MMVETMFASPSIILLVLNVIDNSFALLPLIVLGPSLKRIPLHYALFALALAAFSISFPAAAIIPMISQPRLTIVIFPIFVILAVWGKNPRFNMCYLGLALALLIINIILFIGNIWVA